MKNLSLFFSLCLSANLFAQAHDLFSDPFKNMEFTDVIDASFLESQYARVKVTGANVAKVNDFLEKGVALDHIDWLDAEKTAFIAELSKKEISIIKNQKNCAVEVLISDLTEYYAHQNDDIKGKNQGFNSTNAYPTGFNLGSMGGYLTFAEYVLELDSLTMRYPTLVSPKFSIGATIEGRNIWAIKISDNVATDEAEAEVLIDGLIHAREGVAGMQSMYFIHDLLQKYTQNNAEAKFLVNNRELFIVPVINPDGYEYNRSTAPNGGGMWRKNRRDNGDGSFGVDLNRNWGHFWGYDNSGSSPDPSSDLYRGTAGFSEPETQAMRNFVNSRTFKTALNHHTYSNLMIRPFGYNESTICPDEAAFVAYGPILTAENGFLYGKASETVGYNVNGCTDDWMYGEATTKPRIISFTPETGSSNDGFWPPLVNIVPLCEIVEPSNFKIVWLAGEYFEGYPNEHNINTFTGFVPFHLQNFGQSASQPVSVKFVSSSPYILANTPNKNLGVFASLVAKNDSVQVNIATNTPNNTLIVGEIQVVFSGYTYSMYSEFLFKRPIVATETGAADAAKITLFPNPAQDKLSITTTANIKHIIINDVLGRATQTQNFDNQANTYINITNLQKGVYFINFYNKENELLGSAKFVKE